MLKRTPSSAAEEEQAQSHLRPLRGRSPDSIASSHLIILLLHPGNVRLAQSRQLQAEGEEGRGYRR